MMNGIFFMPNGNYNNLKDVCYLWLVNKKSRTLIRDFYLYDIKKITSSLFSVLLQAVYS